MQFVKSRTVAFIGSRKLVSATESSDFDLEGALREELYLELERCYRDDKRCYLCSMTEGWGMLCAEEILRLQRYYLGVELVVVMPFSRHSARYRAGVKAIYNEILAQADKILILSENNSSRTSYDKCNEYLIENSSEIIVYHNSRGGSRVDVAVNLAMWRGVRVIDLNHSRGE